MPKSQRMKRRSPPPNDYDPDAVIAKHRESLRRAEERGERPPPSVLNAIGDAYLDKGELVSAVQSFRGAAEAYASEGLHQNAVACCRKIQRYAPEEAQVGVLVGRYLAAAGLKADAIGALTSHADRQVRRSDRGGGMEALEEILRIDPEHTEARERLAGLYREEGELESAAAEYRDLLEEYGRRGDLEGVHRLQEALAEIRSPAVEVDGPGNETATPGDGEPAARSAAIEGTERVGDRIEAELVPRGLTIDPTSYEEVTPNDDLEITVTEPDPREEIPTEAVAEDVTSCVDVPEYSEEVVALEEKVRMDPEAHEEMAALATRYEETGRVEEAARLLSGAARGFQEKGLWSEAVAAFRRLHRLEAMTVEAFGEWTEAARQTGDGRLVLGALEAASRWYIERRDLVAAQQAAEEMLLIDPESASAEKILASLGSALPGGDGE